MRAGRRARGKRTDCHRPWYGRCCTIGIAIARPSPDCTPWGCGRRSCASCPRTVAKPGPRSRPRLSTPVVTRRLEPSMRDLARISGAFARARWGDRFKNREALLAWQQHSVDRFLRTCLPRAPFYRDYRGARLDELPTVDKRTMLANFAAFNTRGIALEQALDVALTAERSRDFLPTIEGLTVGLSSGTSGTRGVFLVSPEERQRWAGLILA